jgi:hypothetical protein
MGKQHMKKGTGRKLMQGLLLTGVVVGLGLSLAINGCTIYSSTATEITINGVPVPQKKLSWRDKESISKEDLRVYYPAGYQNLAEDALAIIEAQKAVVEQLTGLEVNPFALLLHGPMKENEYAGVIRGRPIRNGSIWGIAMLEPEHDGPPILEDAIYWVMTHEMTELTLADSVSQSLYIQNPYLRWIGDGCAEYVSYKATSQLKPSVCLKLLKAQRKALERLALENYNLLLFKSRSWSSQRQPSNDIDFAREELAQLSEEDRCFYTDPDCAHFGYSVSLAFWIDFVDTHGEEAFKHVVQELGKQKSYKNADICRMVETITGTSVYEQCRRFSVIRAVDILRKKEAELEVQLQEQ